MAPSPNQDYSVRDVAKLLDLTANQIRSYVRAGLVEPSRGPRGELRFSFSDLAFLRVVRGLSAAVAKPQRLRRALEGARRRVASDRELRDLHLDTSGDQVIVREDARSWNAESGQYLLEFDPQASRGGDVVSLLDRTKNVEDAEVRMSSNDWVELGRSLEEEDPSRARDAYQHAIDLDGNAEAHLEMGCLDHEAGKLQDAARHFRTALPSLPEDPTPQFNLGVVLEDTGDIEAARAAYRAALGIDAGFADAHYNLARIADREGDAAAVILHLTAYRKLSGLTST